MNNEQILQLCNTIGGCADGISKCTDPQRILELCDSIILRAKDIKNITNGMIAPPPTPFIRTGLAESDLDKFKKQI
jgi:hypothetical protein